MKKEEERELEKKLREKEQKLETQLAEFRKDLDFGGETDHFEEEADEAEEFGTWLGLKRLLGQQLARVRLALSKIKIGSYGICESCGNPIERELLAIDPESTLCKRCKTKRRS